MLRGLIMALLLPACTLEAPLTDPHSSSEYASLQKLPSELLITISNFLALHDSIRIHSLFKSDHQQLNSLTRSSLNPFTHHAVKDGEDAIKLIKKAPNHILLNLLNAYLKNPSLKNVESHRIMALALLTGRLEVVEAFTDYYHIPLCQYLLELGYIMGFEGNLEWLERFFRDQRVHRFMPAAGDRALHGAVSNRNPQVVQWLLNAVNVDPSQNNNLLFKDAMVTGSFDIAAILFNDQRVSQTLEPDILHYYLTILRSQSLFVRPLLWPQIDQFDGFCIIILVLMYLLLPFAVASATNNIGTSPFKKVPNLLFYPFATTLSGHKEYLFSVEAKLPFHRISKHYQSSTHLSFKTLHTLTKPVTLPKFNGDISFIRHFASNKGLESTKSVETKSVKSESKLTEVIFGSIAGIVGKIIEHPFDTVKTRLQVQPLNGVPAFSGTLDCIKQGLNEEGLRSFYKGLTAPLIGSMFENSVLFVSYSRIQNAIRNYSGQAQDSFLSHKQLCLAGFLSGGCVSFVLTPVELIKTKLQVQSPYGALKGPLSVIYHTVRQNGLFGLYRGHMSTFMRESVGGAAWFGTYEYFNAAFLKRSAVKGKDELPTWQLMVSGALSGIAYNASLFPVDTIKSRAQAFDSNDSFKKIATDIFRADGIRGFYRGFGITIARSAPSSAIIFATYEWLSRNVRIEY